MTIELEMLGLSVVLGIVYLGAATPVFRRDHLKWAIGAQDEPAPQPTRVSGRLQRAFRNYLETFPFFVAAVLVAHHADIHNWMTEWGVNLYFWGRVIYLPVYAAGIPVIRSLVWDIATAGIVLILIGMVI